MITFWQSVFHNYRFSIKWVGPIVITSHRDWGYTSKALDSTLHRVLDGPRAMVHGYPAQPPQMVGWDKAIISNRVARVFILIGYQLVMRLS